MAGDRLDPIDVPKLVKGYTRLAQQLIDRGFTRPGPDGDLELTMPLEQIRHDALWGPRLPSAPAPASSSRPAGRIDALRERHRTEAKELQARHRRELGELLDDLDREDQGSGL